MCRQQQKDMCVLKSRLLFSPATPLCLFNNVTSSYTSHHPYTLKHHTVAAVLFLQEFPFCL